MLIILIMVFIKKAELYKEVQQVFIKIPELLFKVILMEYQLMVKLKVIIL